MKNTEMKQQMIQYLMKTSRHLFKNERGRFYKVQLTKVGPEQWVYITIEWDEEDYFDFKVTEVKVTDPENSLALMKYDIFPQWEEGVKAVKYFKEGRRKVFEIIKLVRNNYDGSTASVDNMKDEAKSIMKEVNKAA